MTGPGAAAVLDCRGQRCPLPVIALAKAVLAAAPGEEVVLLADDPAADVDVPAWARLRGPGVVARLVTEPLEGGGTRFLVRRA